MKSTGSYQVASLPEVAESDLRWVLVAVSACLVASVFTVGSVPCSFALTVEPRSVSHCDVHVLVTRLPLHGAHVDLVPEFVRDECVAEAVQFYSRHTRVFHRDLEFAEQVTVHLAIFLREEEPLR